MFNPDDMIAMVNQLDKNNWHLVAMQSAPGKRAIILASRSDNDGGLKPKSFLTAEWMERHFFGGHYDMGYQEALADMVERFKSLRRLSW